MPKRTTTVAAEGAPDFILMMKLFAPPFEIYTAWLDSEEHEAMTGSFADIDPSVGGHFSSWDGYATGEILELIPDKRIVQTWHADDFPDDAPPSILTIELTSENEYTVFTLKQTFLPTGMIDQFRARWLEYYFEPMKTYFGTE